MNQSQADCHTFLGLINFICPKYGCFALANYMVSGRVVGDFIYFTRLKTSRCKAYFIKNGFFSAANRISLRMKRFEAKKKINYFFDYRWPNLI